MEPLAGDDPRVLGGYRLLGRLGAGGMGRVYLGRSAGGRTVAVKIVHAQLAADDQFRARFRREIESARRVGGAWTAPVLDADPDASVPWVATGYVAGPSLAQAIADVGPLAEHSVRALGAGLAEALAAVHGLGLVHRDVKPSNVMLTLDGPLLIDFGIARAMAGTVSLTSTGVSVGSPGYMAPEQIVGTGAAGAADVFSLGAVLAFAATGVSPFAGDSSAALLYKVVHEEPVLGPQLVGEVRELVVACLAKDPAGRPAPAELAARLSGEASGGAAGLVRSGWLPGPVVEQVSRRAVELLSLEAAGEEPGGASLGPATQAHAGPATPTPYGPATPAPYGPATPDPANPGMPPPPQGELPSGLVPFDTQVSGAFGAPARPEGPPSAPWPVAGVAAAEAPTADAAPKERRVALTGAVGGKERPRRVSCTLVLSVAGALAVATTAAVFFRLLPGGPGGADTAAKPPPGSGAPTPGPTVAPHFLGTWTGSVTTARGMGNGSMTSVIRPGGKGDYVIHTTYDVVVVQCKAKAKLVSATPNRLVLRERPDGKQGFGCTGSASRVTYTFRKDGTLAFTSDDGAGGTPTSTLTKR
ncbi:serine/threonine-protein kinase [Streptomyces gilvosporeus]|uniref:Serine/threonine protein kinase n=1 Tax=Streptomyces gilvosporeus TaxID=553510 RepID=A0A1V0TT27_9ACTN|nr:serine/threonine-protein kinase [Streptomyces gilvosporeus]ARF56043.1 serine/threonine protein kinase [Streptomyces gilvosporeus]